MQMWESDSGYYGSNTSRKDPSMILLSIIFLLVVLAVVSAVMGSPMFFVVRQQESSIIERLGKFNRIVTPGFNASAKATSAWKHSSASSRLASTS